MPSGKKNLVKNFEMLLSVNIFEKLNKNIKIKRKLQVYMHGRKERRMSMHSDG